MRCVQAVKVQCSLGKNHQVMCSLTPSSLRTLNLEDSRDGEFCKLHVQLHLYACSYLHHTIILLSVLHNNHAHCCTCTVTCACTVYSVHLGPFMQTIRLIGPVRGGSHCLQNILDIKIAGLVLDKFWTKMSDALLKHTCS